MIRRLAALGLADRSKPEGRLTPAGLDLYRTRPTRGRRKQPEGPQTPRSPGSQQNRARGRPPKRSPAPPPPRAPGSRYSGPKRNGGPSATPSREKPQGRRRPATPCQERHKPQSEN